MDSSAGGVDIAYFYDDPNSSETFTGNQTLSRFKRNNPGWDIAQNFDMVYAYATMTPSSSSITDIAEVTDSLSNDIIRTYGRYDAWNVNNEGYIRYNGLSTNQVLVRGFDQTKFKVTTGGATR